MDRYFRLLFILALQSSLAGCTWIWETGRSFLGLGTERAPAELASSPPGARGSPFIPRKVHGDESKGGSEATSTASESSKGVPHSLDGTARLSAEAPSAPKPNKHAHPKTRSITVAKAAVKPGSSLRIETPKVQSIPRPVSYRNPGKFHYLPPGNLSPLAGMKGVPDMEVHSPGIEFPVLGAPAFLSVLLVRLRQPPHEECVDAIYRYPWQDTYCEPHHRGSGANQCPLSESPRGNHAGVDITAGDVVSCRYHLQEQKNSNAANLLQVVAVADGKVTVTRDDGVLVLVNGTHRYTYLHMNKDGMRVKAPQQVKRGELLGYVWNTNTAYHHLHFEVERVVNPGRFARVSPYISLVRAYESSPRTAQFR